MSKPTQSGIPEDFSEIRKYGCRFANMARVVFSTPSWRSDIALDKLEVQIQHNEADLSTWLYLEKIMVFQSKWMRAYCEFDTGLALLANLVQEEAIEKLQTGDTSIEVLQHEAENT